MTSSIEKIYSGQQYGDEQQGKSQPYFLKMKWTIKYHKMTSKIWEAVLLLYMGA